MAPIYRFPPTQGPVSRFLSLVVLLLIFSLAFVVGTFVFLAVLCLIAVLLVVFYLRFWSLRRKLARDRSARPAQEGVTLEGEYTISKVENPRHDDRD